MNIRTTEQVEAARASDEPVIALVVGTSDYPHARAEDLPSERKRYAVESLTSAARSASWFAGWLSTEWSNRDNIEHLEVLLSPAPGEEVDPAVADAWAGCGAPSATLTNFKDAFGRLREKTKNRQSIAIVYLAGHGFQISGRSATVLLHDYLAPGQFDAYEAAINSTGCHASLADGRFAPTQFWFVDACRTSSPLEREFEVLNPGWSPNDAKKDTADVAPIFLASSPWTPALAEKGARSLFSKALEWTLSGGVGSKVPGTQDWAVMTGDLVNNLGPKVKELASEHRRQQKVDATGIVRPAVVHALDRNPYAPVAPDATDATDACVPLDASVASATPEPPSPQSSDVAAPPPTAPPPTAPPIDVPTTTVSFDAHLGSWHLRSIAPFRVIAPNGEVVAERRGPASVELPRAIYRVEMRTPSGDWDTQQADTTGGTPADLTFEYEPAATIGSEIAGGADTDRVKLKSVEEANVLRTGPGLWTFTPESSTPPRVPRATFEVDGITTIISLPINPAYDFPRNACTVQVDDDLGVRAGVTPERIVSKALESMVETEQVGSSIDLFEESSDLLLGKYRDPVGAVLGGLTLHRLGYLKEREGWVTNLARDFPWLPDGLALRAALMSVDDDDDVQREGLALLLEAAEHRPMYTDGLALIVDLLQRWPTEDEEADRLELLAHAGNFISMSVRTSIFLLTEHGESQ